MGLVHHHEAAGIFDALDGRFPQSIGESVRRSITSGRDSSSLASASAASNALWTIRPYVTIVASLPSRTTFGSPNGTCRLSAGTSLPAGRTAFCVRKKMTGSLSRIDWMSSPLASYGVGGDCHLQTGNVGKDIGTALRMLGRCSESPAPTIVRMTTGVVALPPNMYLNLAAWLKIWSKQTPMKSTNISSATGRMPQGGRPMAAPDKADSEIRRIHHAPGNL